MGIRRLLSCGLKLYLRVTRNLNAQGPQHYHNIRRARSAVHDGQYTKAIQALTSEGLASPSNEVLNEMISKHPQVPPATLPAGPAPTPPTISESAVKKSFKSFPSGSAPGPSGLRPTHVREAMLCPSADRSGESLFGFNKICQSAVLRPDATICPPPFLWCLNCLQEKEWRSSPNCCGEVLRRLVSKCLAQAVRSSALSVLAPLQLGVNVKGGCEAIIHAVSHLMNSPSNQRWILLLDFTNTFNSVDRQAMFAEIRIPSLSA